MAVAAALDHLLLGVADLDDGMEWVERLTGVKAMIGGRHPGAGTRNALVSLGDRRYLEIIAPDPTQTAYAFPIDLRLLSHPRVITWAVATTDVDSLARKARDAGYQIVGPHEGARARPDGTVIRWKTLSVLNQAGEPGVEPVPFFIEWATGAPHPSQDSPGGCALTSFHIEHPDPPGVVEVLNTLGVDAEVRRSGRVSLHAALMTPKGEVVLS